MAIVTRCSVDGCETLTIGPLCVDHDVKTTRDFDRGRPMARTLAAAPTGVNLEIPAPALPRPSSSLVGIGLEADAR